MKEHRYVAAFCLTVLALCVAGMAQAQTRVTACDATTPNNAICITGTGPVKYTDGTTIDKPLTYRVEQRVGTTGDWVTVATGLTTLKYYAQKLAPGDYFFRVYASCTPNCADSVPSNVASKSATPPITTPEAPTIIIAATIRAGQPPVYRIIQSVNLRPNEVVFAAPASMRPIFAAR